MRDWRATTLGEVVRMQRGHDLPADTRTTGTVPVMGSFGITGWHNEVKASGPGVTIGRSGASIGTVAYIEQDYWPLNTCMYVTDFMGNDPRFCYYWLRTLGLARFNSGSAQPSLNRNYIYGMPVRIPEVDEQKEIVDILGALDDKIELNRRMNGTLEAMAQALFKEWFVDGAKEEWGEVPLKALFSINKASVNPGSTPEEVFDHYSIPAFDEGRVPKQESGASIKSNKFIVPERCILLSKLNPRFPRVWVPVLDGNRRAIGSTEFIVCVPKSDALREFIFGLFTSEAFIGEFTNMATGSTGSHQRVRPESMLNMTTVMPDRSTLKSFSDLVRPMLERINANIAESQTLTALRDTLLPKLMRGEVRVKNTTRMHSPTWRQ